MGFASFGQRVFDGSGGDLAVPHIFSVLLSFVTVPMAGFYFALRFKKFLSILTATLVAGLLGPLYAFDPLGRFFSGSTIALATLGCHVLLIRAFFRKSRQQLRARDFAI